MLVIVFMFMRGFVCLGDLSGIVVSHPGYMILYASIFSENTPHNSLFSSEFNLAVFCAQMD